MKKAKTLTAESKPVLNKSLAARVPVEAQEPPASITVASDVLELQRLIGNRAVLRLFQNRDVVQPSPAAVPAVVQDVLRAPGQPLDQAVRRDMEEHFNCDFRAVRIHSNDNAAASATAVDALAYTVGDQIVFGKAQYAPAMGAGRHLLAHELAHVIQQRRGGAPPSATRDCALETFANRAATAVLRNDGPVAVAGSSAPGLARQPKPESPLRLPKEGIEMPWVGKGAPASELGYLRDPNYFWKEYAKRWPNQLSPQNMANISKPAPIVAPIVDDTWLPYHPEHKAYKGQTLEHHHVGQGSRAVPLPEKLHDAYTVFHPRRQVVGEGTKPLKPLKPRPTRVETETEIARHTKAGRIAGAGISPERPPQALEVPPSSVVAGVPPSLRRPVDPATSKIIANLPKRAPKVEFAKPPTSKAITGEAAPTQEISAHVPTAGTRITRGEIDAAAGVAAAEIIISVATNIIQSKYVDKQNEERFQKDLKALQPSIEGQIAGQSDVIHQLQSGGLPAYANTTVRVSHQADRETGLVFYAGMSLEKMAVSNQNINREEIPQMSIWRALLPTFGRSETLITYSFELPPIAQPQR